MSNSDIRTTAASNDSPSPATEPSDQETNAETRAQTGRAEPAKMEEKTAPGPTDPLHPAQDIAPHVPLAAADAERISDPDPTPRVPGQGPVKRDPTGTRQAPTAARKPTEMDGTAVSGGFSGINNWLDSMPEPNWGRLGDKIYAAPSTFRATWRQWRIERAAATELKERNRLAEAARAEAQAEAQAEAKKRATVKQAHQAKLDAAAQRAVEGRLAAQTQEQANARAAGNARIRAMAAAGTQANAPAESTATKQDTDSPTSVPAPNRESDPRELAALVASAKAAIDQQQSMVEPLYVAPYILPDFSPNPAEQPSDTVRRILGSAAALAGTAVSFLVLDPLVSGTVESLGSNYSMMSLAPTAHLIWPVMFIWAVLGAAYSWAPAQRSAVRQRAVGLPFALACTSSVLWIACALNSWLVPAFIAAAAGCWFLCTAVRALNRNTARTMVERMLTDAPISLMTGFSLVVLASTSTNMLASWGAGGAGIWVATILVPAVGYAAVTLTMTERGRIILAIGVGWGMFWLLVPRVLGSNNSIWIAILAGMAGFVVLLATENRRYQIHHAEHRAARGKSTDFS